MVSNQLQSTNVFPGPSPQEFRRLGYQAVDFAVQYLASLGDGPVYKPMKPEERVALTLRKVARMRASNSGIVKGLVT
jgi:hypothetical protein